MRRTKSPTRLQKKNKFPNIVQRRPVTTLKSPKAASYEQIKKMLKENPFNLPSDDKLIENLDIYNGTKSRRRSVIDGDLEISKHNSIFAIHSEGLLDSKDDPPVADHQMRQDVHAFVDQTRDILVSQIKIDRKRNEILRIIQQQKTEKAIIENEVSKIAEVNNQYEMTANGIKAQLQRAKTEMERSFVQKQEVMKQLKLKKESVAKIKSEITKNEDAVFVSRNYKVFLESLTPPGKDPLQHFDEPEKLTNDIQNLEDENLFLIKKCAEMENEEERALETIQIDLTKATEEKNEMEEASKHLVVIDPIECDKTQLFRDTDSIEKERIRLAKIVETTYEKCFSNNADMNPIMMLEKIENGLESLYKCMGDVSESFIQEKQAQFDKERRERARINRQRQKVLEQQKKTKAALERAQRPIKAKVGRPVRARVLPYTFHRKEDNGKTQDEKLKEEFLFGPIQF